MTREEYIQAFKKFTAQEQQEIVMALMPDFCGTMMREPAQMQEMMKRCQQMMGGSFMPKNWRMPGTREKE